MLVHKKQNEEAPDQDSPLPYGTHAMYPALLRLSRKLLLQISATCKAVTVFPAQRLPSSVPACTKVMPNGITPVNLLGTARSTSFTPYTTAF